MWRLVREGLRLYRPVLLGAWLYGILGVVAVFAALALVRAIGVHAALVWVTVPWPVTLLIASSVAGWIALGSDMGEHRVRLQMSLPVPIVEVALARLLLPIALLVLGLPLAQAVGAIATAVYGSQTPWLGHARLLLLAVHLVFLQQLAFGIREVVGLRDRGRWMWVPGVLVLFLLCAPAWGWIVFPDGGPAVRIAVMLGLTAVLMAFTIALFCRRRRFTT